MTFTVLNDQVRPIGATIVVPGMHESEAVDEPDDWYLVRLPSGFFRVRP